MRSFTEEELSKYDGKNGSPAYVAYKGKVYDVSKSFLWHNGRHQVLHDAGRALTDELENAPHNEEMIFKFPVAGKLER